MIIWKETVNQTVNIKINSEQFGPAVKIEISHLYFKIG